MTCSCDVHIEQGTVVCNAAGTAAPGVSQLGNDATYG